MTDSEIYDWDSKIGEEADEGGFVILPAGEYPFEVTGIERGRYDGNPQKGTKPCPRAIVSIRIHGGDLGSTTIKERINLNKRSAWKIKEFFVSIGLIDAAAKEFVPNWSGSVGCHGICMLKKYQFDGRDGDIVDANDVKKFLPPATGATSTESTPAAPAFSFPAGA
ncbi:MAG: hypothetical protein RSB04_11900 [Gordonibacter sp.]|uniref:hypothetical protein n=1 Tax=Gordonibacter sp. TaxID=1968902 RepID=UPI002FC99BF2